LVVQGRVNTRVPVVVAYLVPACLWPNTSDWDECQDTYEASHRHVACMLVKMSRLSAGRLWQNHVICDALKIACTFVIWAEILEEYDNGKAWQFVANKLCAQGFAQWWKNEKHVSCTHKRCFPEQVVTKVMECASINFCKSWEGNKCLRKPPWHCPWWDWHFQEWRASKFGRTRAWPYVRWTFCL